ncbi:hypothetical protein GS538_08535 [Rhodococcus hoagii]|nr:hypothetical protein [Prescottella equi]
MPNSLEQALIACPSRHTAPTATSHPRSSAAPSGTTPPVVAAAYRRSFHELAGTMRHAAEAAARRRALPILVELGTRQRAELRD